MGTRNLGFGLLLAGLLWTPAFAADDKKTGGKDDTTKHVDADTIPVGAYTGKLQDVPGKDGTFTVQIDASHLEPKSANYAGKTNQEMQNVARDQAHVAQLEAELARAKTAKESQRISRDIDKALAQLQKQLALAQKTAQDLKVVTVQKTVDFQSADELKVRIMTLPVVYDDEGKIKAYTDEEKKTLKGKDTQLPGYEAKRADLKTGDVIRLTLGRKAPPKKTEGDKDTSDTAKDTGAKKTQVTIVVILNEDKADKDKDSTPKKK